MNDEILKIIYNGLKEINLELRSPSLDNPTPETVLYGRGGCLDSLSLVSLISDIEGKISDKFRLNIVLADERAMSQIRSPFKNVSSLKSYILSLFEEQL